MYAYKKEGKRDSGKSIKRVAAKLSTGTNLPCEKSNFRMKSSAVPQTIMFRWRKQTNSKMLPDTIQQAPIQMFKYKSEQTQDAVLDAILTKEVSEWTKQEAEIVKESLDEEKIEAESNEELDKLYGILYGGYYDDFPDVEEFTSNLEQGVYKEWEGSSGNVSQNQGNIFTDNEKYFIKKVSGARSAANEAIIPVMAMRLGLQEHAVPAVWYQIGDDHYVVTKLMHGQSLKNVSEIAEENAVLPDNKLIELFLFDFLVGSYDRTITNVFLNEGNIKLIDNEGSLGLNGRGKEVGKKSGISSVRKESAISRVGNKSPFLAAFFKRHGVKQHNEMIMASALQRSKVLDNPEINMVIDKSLLERMIIIGQEARFLLEEFHVPTDNLESGIQHMSELMKNDEVHLKDFVI